LNQSSIIAWPQLAYKPIRQGYGAKKGGAQFLGKLQVTTSSARFKILCAPIFIKFILLFF
jgi:hypothetical protein